MVCRGSDALEGPLGGVRIKIITGPEASVGSDGYRQNAYPRSDPRKVQSIALLNYSRSTNGTPIPPFYLPLPIPPFKSVP